MTNSGYKIRATIGGKNQKTLPNNINVPPSNAAFRADLTIFDRKVTRCSTHRIKNDKLLHHHCADPAPSVSTAKKRGRIDHAIFFGSRPCAVIS